MRLTRILRGSGSAVATTLLVAVAGPVLVDFDGTTVPILRSVAEVVIVDAQNPLGTTTLTALEAGRPYVIEVTGTYTFDPVIGTADAECSTWAPDTTYQRTRPGAPEPVLDVVINELLGVDWQPVQADGNGCDTTNHAYRSVLTLPESQALNFRVKDTGSFTDNAGFLTVRIIDQLVETTAETVKSEVDGVKGEADNTAATIRDTVNDLTASTLPSGPTTTVPDTPPTTVPSGPTTTVPDTPPTSVPDTPPTTAPDTPPTTVLGGSPDPGPVAEAVAAVLDQIGGTGVPGGGVSPQPDPDPNPGPTPNPNPGPTPNPGPSPQPEPAPSPNPGSPPVGGAPALGPGEGGGPGPSSPPETGTVEPVATAAASDDTVVSGGRADRAAGRGDAAPTGQPADDGLAAYDVAIDLPSRDDTGDSDAGPGSVLRPPINAAGRSPLGFVLVAGVLVGSTALLSLRAIRRIKAERVHRAYRYR